MSPVTMMPALLTSTSMRPNSDYGFSDQFTGPIAVAQVRDERRRLHAGRFGKVSRGARHRLLDVDEHDPIAVVGEGLGACQPYTAGSAGNQYDFSLGLHGESPRSVRTFPT